MDHRKNLPHTTSAVDVERAVINVSNGLYRYKRVEHSISNNTKHVDHEIQPVTSISSTFYNGNNNFTDFNIPKHLDYYDDEYLEITLANSSSTAACVFGAPVFFLNSRIEVRVDGQIKQTLRDTTMYQDYLLYNDQFHFDMHEAQTAVSNTTYGIDTTFGTVATEASRTWRIHLKTFLSQCGIPISSCDNNITIRVYSNNVTNLLASGTGSDLTCTSLRLFVREVKGNSSKLRQVASKNLDWRFLDSVVEEPSLTLTSGSTTKYVTNNFDNSDLYSHVSVVIRNANMTGSHIQNFLNNANKVYFEDQSGQSLHNGIQWSNTQLLEKVYPDKFPNMVSQTDNRSIYLPLVPSTDPVNDYKLGSMGGSDSLHKNMKIVIEASASATRLVTITAKVFRHCRLSAGKLVIY
jgi:hypothetical protein